MDDINIWTVVGTVIGSVLTGFVFMFNAGRELGKIRQYMADMDQDLKEMKSAIKELEDDRVDYWKSIAMQNKETNDGNPR